MYYLKSRYYQPEICRFISADDEDVLSVKTDFDDCNLYAYCDNNPISRLDETGDVWQAALAGGWVIGGSNAWNPVGQTVLGIITAVSVVYGAKKLYKFAKSKRGTAQPELKKQGRENQEKRNSKIIGRKSLVKNRDSNIDHIIQVKKDIENISLCSKFDMR